MLLSTRYHGEPGWLVLVVQLLVLFDFYFFGDPLNVFAVQKTKLAVVTSTPTEKLVLDVNNFHLAGLIEAKVLLT